MDKAYFCGVFICTAHALFGSAEDNSSSAYILHSTDWHEASPATPLVHDKPKSPVSIYYRNQHQITRFSHKLIHVTGPEEAVQLLLLSSPHAAEKELMIQKIATRRHTALDMKGIKTAFSNALDPNRRISFFVTLFTFLNHGEISCTFIAGNESCQQKEPTIFFEPASSTLKGVEYIKINTETLIAHLFYTEQCKDVHTYTTRHGTELTTLTAIGVDEIADRRDAFLKSVSAHDVIFKANYPEVHKLARKYKPEEDCRVI